MSWAAHPSLGRGGRPSEAAAVRRPHGRRLRPPPAGGGGRPHRRRRPQAAAACLERPPPPPLVRDGEMGETRTENLACEKTLQSCSDEI